MIKSVIANSLMHSVLNKPELTYVKVINTLLYELFKRPQGIDPVYALFRCRLSFATDIARGMSYLHQHKVFHGRLHSRNCVIDDRWVCKISGTKSQTQSDKHSPDKLHDTTQRAKGAL